MTKQEFKALKTIIEYILDNEENSYQEYLQEHGFGVGHIYDYALTMGNYIDRFERIAEENENDSII